MTRSLRSCFALFLALVVVAFTTCAVRAQAPAAGPRPAASKPGASTGIIRGHVADPTGALIPGVKITIVTATGATAALVTADGSGAYSASGLPAGSYIVKASADGFTPAASELLPLLPGQSKRVDIAMAILAEQQSVTVTDEEAPMVSVEASGNTSSVVLKDKDLDALSDDPDELSNELTALAGPAAGPNGGEVYIGGFTGGQLPPKSAIREIRINQNPFSAEFDHLGYGRIEILTKPGTDQLHGRFFMQGNDDAFNTGNPFTSVIPAYHSIQYNGSISGSLGKQASYFFNAEQRDNQNASIYTVNTAVPTTSSTAPWTSGTVSGSVFSPSTHTEISPRVDIQLGQKNTLTARYQYERYHQSGSIGSLQTPDQATTSNFVEHTLQLSDSLIVNDHIVNETRFQYLRDLSTSTPVSAAPSVSVSGDFTSGGAGGQYNNDHTDHLELWNITTMTAGTHAIKFGTRLRWNRDANATDSNFNGSFSFSSLSSYLTLLNDQANSKTWTQIAADGGLPNTLTYTTGPKAVQASVFDGTLFFQDDWKANKFLTLSGGLRWEAQNHVADHDDWGPRAAFAYALDGHKDQKQAKTVLRGGYGIFYDRFGLGNLLNMKRYSGGADSQTQSTITNPTCFTSTSLGSINLASCGLASASAKTTIEVTPTYHSPYTGQLSLSLERQLTKTTSMTVTGLRSYGVHQMVTRDANAYLPGTFVYGSATLTGTRPNPAEGIVEQYDSQAFYKQNQLIVNMNAAPSQRFSLSGFYNLTSTHTDTGTASNSWDLKHDYRRSSWTPRHMVFLMGNYVAPFKLVFNPFLIAQSARPYNFVSPYDLTGDNFFNDRPSLLSSSTCPVNPNPKAPRYAQTSYGCFDMTPDPTETVIPGNMGNGPSSVAFNLRVSRAIGLGPKLPGAAGQSGGFGGGGRGPMGGPGFGGGFGGGGRGPSSISTGHKYSLTFSAQALNLFNNIDYAQPVGTVNSSHFGQSTSLAGGIFSSGSAARRVFFQASFAF